MTRTDVYRSTLRHFLAPVADLLYDDESVTEVLVNGPEQIYCERAGRLEFTGRKFADAHALECGVRNIAEYVGRRIDADHPSMDARLPEPEQFRVHAVIPPASRVGICLSIRKFRRANTSLDWLVGNGSITVEAADYLTGLVRGHKNVLVSGGTGSGKTSLLNALSAVVDPAERIVVIEDSSELRLLQPHVVYLEAVPPNAKGVGGRSVRDLFVDSLRMRPDRIIVGEVRRGEALDLVQSMLSGHDGSLSTVHASGPYLALVRLETLCLMNSVELPVYVARTQVASAVHAVVQVARLPDGRRCVTGVAEVGGLKTVGPDSRYRLRTIFDYQHGRLTRTDKPSRLLAATGPVIVQENLTRGV